MRTTIYRLDISAIINGSSSIVLIQSLNVRVIFKHNLTRQGVIDRKFLNLSSFVIRGGRSVDNHYLINNRIVGDLSCTGIDFQRAVDFSANVNILAGCAGHVDVERELAGVEVGAFLQLHVRCQILHQIEAVAGEVLERVCIARGDVQVAFVLDLLRLEQDLILAQVYDLVVRFVPCEDVPRCARVQRAQLKAAVFQRNQNIVHICRLAVLCFIHCQQGVHVLCQ